MKYALYLLLTMSLLAESCRCHDESCTPGSLCIDLHGFDSSELHGITMRQFDTSGFYVNLLQTIRCDDVYHDTVDGVAHTLLSCGPGGNYDWEIIFPSIPKTVRIYDMAYPYQTQRVCSGFMDKLAPCTSPISSYKQDSVAHQATGPRTDHSDCIQIYR